MPRKYAGPLMPGQRSAYVPGTRRNVSKVRAVRAIQSAWRRYKNKPSRLAVSTSRYRLNKAIAKQINNMSENKFSGYAGYCLVPQPKPAGTQPMTYIFHNTGEPLTQPSNSMFTSMDLFNFPRGDSNVERNGDYMYIKKSHVKIEIQMLPISSDDITGLNSTTEFRLMIVKANRKYNKLGASPLAGNSLFLGPTNSEFGFGVPGGTSTAAVYANMKQPINKRKWLVYKDMTFTLSTPAQEIVDNAVPSEFAFNTSNNKYRVKKHITCDLPVFKKTHFAPDSNVPDELDTQWLIVIQAVRSNYCSPNVDVPRNWVANILATTSASDN